MHWSYAEKCDGDLAQGDILLPTSKLREALRVAHGWFNDPKYLGFVVISQTCDLVRRNGGPCKTPYTEIAVIRPLRPYVLSLLRQQCSWIGDRYFPSTEQNRATELLDRVINQNESALGLFYLHPEATIGIAEESVALLRVSIALRSAEHYESLVGARRGRLDPEFANKLGWLCGNLYSRVGIRDWKDEERDRKAATEIKRGLLSDIDESSPKFVDCPKRFLDDLRAGKLDLSQATAAQIESKITEYTSKSFRDTALEAVARVMEGQNVAEEVRTKVCKVLKSDSEFVGTLRKGSP